MFKYFVLSDLETLRALGMTEFERSNYYIFGVNYYIFGVQLLHIWCEILHIWCELLHIRCELLQMALVSNSHLTNRFNMLILLLTNTRNKNSNSMVWRSYLWKII